MKLLTSTFLLLLVLGTQTLAQNSNNSEGDYKAYPEFPYKIEHLTLNLTVEPSSALIKGIGRYDISSRRDNLREIVLHTSDLEVQEVNAGVRQLEYHVSGDSLVILLDDSLDIGDETQFHITWQSNSTYGIHADIYGYMWTSLQAKANHHWFPVFDHPEAETTIDAYITIPAEFDAVFNGIMIKDEVVSTEKRKIHWKSEAAVPVTGINLAVGKFKRKEAISGVKEITLFAGESDLLDEVGDGLLRIAVNSLKEMERTLSFEYPYEALNIVVLPDHLWDEKQEGAGIVYLYQNLGSLATQLRRGIAAQWFGQYHRYTDAGKNAPNYEFLKYTVLKGINAQQLKNPDSLQSIKAWNVWEERYDDFENEFLKKTVVNSLRDLVKSFSGVTTWGDYADYWYQQTGAYWVKISTTKPSKTETESDIYEYKVDYEFDEQNSTLRLTFTAKGEPLETLAGVEVSEIGFSDTSTTEISFTGIEDVIEVEVSPDVEYVILNPKEDLKIELEENKPFSFFINQLRSSVVVERKEAAAGLKNYADNPDLQLALRDILREEEEPEVRAALLETMGEILGGSSGTEETFLEAMRADELSVRLAAIRALTNYEGNEEVQYAVSNAVIQAEEDTVFNTALKTYHQIADADEVISLANRLENSDSTGIKSLKVLKLVAGDEDNSNALNAADRHLNEKFPSSLRKEALKLLIVHQNDSDYWKSALENLLTDRDPRIRFLSLDAVKHLSTADARELLSTREKEEFDPRVLEKIRELK